MSSELATADEVEYSQSVKPELLELKIQLVEKGRARELLAGSKNCTFRIHCYAPGIGEHGMHAHLDEDHIFVVLQGEVQFSTLDGKLPVMGKNSAVFLPKGCHYEFSNPSNEPLVLIRFGAGQGDEGRRITPTGRFISGRGPQGGNDPVFMEGKFFK